MEDVQTVKRIVVRRKTVNLPNNLYVLRWIRASVAPLDFGEVGDKRTSGAKTLTHFAVYGTNEVAP